MAVKLLLFCVITTLVVPSTTQTTPRIYTIHIGHDWGSHEYFDDEGYLQGFSIGFIDLVCQEGRMDCRVVRDAYKNCWEAGQAGTHPAGGKGLFSGWYDGCLGWGAQVEIIHTFSVSLPYITTKPNYLFVKRGNRGTLDPFDMAGKRLGFISGWGGNEQCLARDTRISNRVLKPDQIKHFVLPDEVIQALQNNQIDFTYGTKGFWTAGQLAQMDSLENTEFNCLLHGPGLMARKDNSIIATWNTAFTKLKNTRKFMEYCEKANKDHEHVGQVECVRN